MQEAQNAGWIPANEAWIQFARKHPEFGVRPTENSWIHFQRTHAKALIEADVIRRIAFRRRMIADVSRFEDATFNLLTTGSVEGRQQSNPRPPVQDGRAAILSVHSMNIASGGRVLPGAVPCGC